jgi:hypothetical protein
VNGNNRVTKCRGHCSELADVHRIYIKGSVSIVAK